MIVKAGGRWYVGPCNGLSELIQRRAGETLSWDIDWKPQRLSASFHGRDLFAPVAAMLARGDPLPGRIRIDGANRQADWPDDLGEIIYIDHFGEPVGVFIPKGRTWRQVASQSGLLMTRSDHQQLCGCERCRHNLAHC